MGLPRKIFRTITVFTLGLLMQTVALAEKGLNMPEGVTPVSKQIYDLHMTIFWICCVIGALVFGVMFYTILMHRRSRGVKAARFHEHVGVEIAWSVIPFLILVAMAIPATKVLFAMHDKANSELTIKVTGYQWHWQYEYLDQGISFLSNLSTPQEQLKNFEPKNKWYLIEVDHPLVLPVDTKVRFLITSSDVIHSWWVPELGVKKDAVPGFIHESWARITKPGTYRGQCAELCGIGHGFMPIVVKAVTKPEFKQWVAEQHGKKAKLAEAATKTWSKDELMKKGEAAYKTSCSACHQVNGEGMPPVFPGLKGTKVATGPVGKHIDVVLNGVANTAMQAFDGNLDDITLAAIITYERNAWGNDKLTEGEGNVVQPSDLTAFRANKGEKK